MKLAPDLLWFVHLQLLGGSPVSTWDMFFSVLPLDFKTCVHRVVADTGVRIVNSHCQFKGAKQLCSLGSAGFAAALPVPAA